MHGKRYDIQKEPYTQCQYFCYSLVFHSIVDLLIRWQGHHLDVISCRKDKWELNMF